MQVKTVPYTDNKLEVRVSASLGLRENKCFVQEFYRWAQRTYPGARIPSVVVPLLTHDMMTDPLDEWGDSDEWKHIAEKSLPPPVELMQEPTPTEDGTGEAELAFLHRQLKDKKENLLLIQERKSEFVMGTSVPLDLIKEERRTERRIEELEQRLAKQRQLPPTPSPTHTTHIGSVTGPVHTGTGDIIIAHGKEEKRLPLSTSPPPPDPERIDFAILTAVKVEIEAVCKAFDLTARDRVREGSRIYWRGRLPLLDGEFYELVVAQSPDMANVDAALVTSDTLHHWKPGALLMVGIAGAASDDVALGDIVLGRDVYYYERGKETPEGRMPEPVMYRADATLWSNVTSLPETAAPILKRPNGREARPYVHQGVIASGEKVIAEAVARDRIGAGHRKILAIEMEGYGVSAAVWQSFERCRHLVIRAICDRADRDKSEDWQPYAAAVAAGFARNFLLDRPLEPRNPAQPKAPTRRTGKPARAAAPQEGCE